MSLKVNDQGGGDFELVPEGLYIARCYRLIDLGTQVTTNRHGTKERKKISVSWELLDEPKMEDNRPFSIHKTYTASLGEKTNLRADLEAWRNKKFTDKELEEFDLTTILGAYCQIQVVHSEDGKYANVQSIVTFKGDKKPAAINEDVAFDIDNPDMKVFEALSDNMKAKIQSAPEWNQKAQPTTQPQLDDVVITDIGDDSVNLADIPF